MPHGFAFCRLYHNALEIPSTSQGFTTCLGGRPVFFGFDDGGDDCADNDSKEVEEGTEGNGDWFGKHDSPS